LGRRDSAAPRYWGERRCEMKRPRILPVDDEKVFAGNMCKLLETRGYIVTAVHDGKSAL